MQDDRMQPRFIAAIASAALIVGSCGSGESGGSDMTAPDITLIATTTQAPPPTEAAQVETDAVVTTPAPIDSTASEPVVTQVAPVETEPVPIDTGGPATEPGPEAEPETTSLPAAGLFTLETSGLGSTSFGADPDGTVTFVSNFLGAPTLDTGWVDPFTIGPCGGTQLRQVSWNNLQLEFGDSSAVTEGRPHFYSYTYGLEGSGGTVTPAGLATAKQITVGSPVAALITAYPGVQLRSADEFIAPNFFINDNLTGRMSGLADTDVVELIIGGIPCDG
ncbi:MAG: hypothetical protein ACJAR2_000497 [Ilumatobacter sp.]|jgi:hypothetical protein